MTEIQNLKILPGLDQIFNFYQNFDPNVKILISLTKVRSNFGPRLDFLSSRVKICGPSQIFVLGGQIFAILGRFGYFCGPGHKPDSDRSGLKAKFP